MFTIISFFQKLIKGWVGIRAGGGLENFSKINNLGDDYSVLESTVSPAAYFNARNVDCCILMTYDVILCICSKCFSSDVFLFIHTEQCLTTSQQKRCSNAA